MTKRQGYTLVELLVVVAIIAVLAGIAIPTYFGYIKSASMNKVVTHHGQAVRAAVYHLLLVTANQSRGGSQLAPQNADSWISVFDQGNKATAPGGGSAYQPGAGDSETGTVGVSLDGEFLSITQPSYADLDQIEVRINTITLDIKRTNLGH